MAGRARKSPDELAFDRVVLFMGTIVTIASFIALAEKCGATPTPSTTTTASATTPSTSATTPTTASASGDARRFFRKPSPLANPVDAAP